VIAELARRIRNLGLMVLFLTAGTPLFATTGQTGLPWETPLATLQQSISGPVAVLIGIIALAAIGVTLIFGGEWNEFARRGVFAVCAIALLVGGGVIMTTLFNVSSSCV
jgi:type IV secretory pathway VirB2 component (pilin)